MGARNPDRFGPDDWRIKAETVAKMIEQGWDVMSKCPMCSLMMRVDLKLVARVSGPETSLWNKRLPCKRIGCTGLVWFMAKPPRYPTFFQMDAAWPPGRNPKATL